MKISETDHITNLQAYIQSGKDKAGVENSGKVEDPASKQVHKQKESGSEKVELSGRAKELQKLSKLLETVPDIKEEKIAKIKEEIEKGDYEIKEQEIAAKMIRESILDELL